MDSKQLKSYVIFSILLISFSIVVANNNTESNLSIDSESTTPSERLLSTPQPKTFFDWKTENPDEAEKSSDEDKGIDKGSSSSEEDGEFKKAKKLKTREKKQHYADTLEQLRTDVNQLKSEQENVSLQIQDSEKNIQCQLAQSKALIRNFQREIQTLKNSLDFNRRTHQMEIDSLHGALRTLRNSLSNYTNDKNGDNTEKINGNSNITSNTTINKTGNNYYRNNREDEKSTILRQMSSQIQSNQHYIRELRDQLGKLIEQTKNSNFTSSNNNEKTSGYRRMENLSVVQANEQNKLDDLQKSFEEQKVELNSLRRIVEELQRREISPVHKYEKMKALDYNRDCSDVFKRNQRANNSHTNEIKVNSPHQIYPSGPDGQPVNVLCDGGWTIIQQRGSGPREEFYRTWKEYEDGFESVSNTNSSISSNKNRYRTLGNYWIGLKAIEGLTRGSNYNDPSSNNIELRIELVDWEGNSRFAQYSNFYISNASDSYRLTIGEYFGNAGDSLSYHNGSAFSTWDQDNDGHGDINCALKFHGGWWYKNCLTSNLNGLYRAQLENSYPAGDSIFWDGWRGWEYSLRNVQIKIRPKENNEDL